MLLLDERGAVCVRPFDFLEKYLSVLHGALLGRNVIRIAWL